MKYVLEVYFGNMFWKYVLEICWKYVLEVFLSIYSLFFPRRGFHDLNRRALLRSSKLHPCTPSFWKHKNEWTIEKKNVGYECWIDLFKRFKFSSNIPSNSVQHNKKMLDLNVDPFKSALIWQIGVIASTIKSLITVAKSFIITKVQWYKGSVKVTGQYGLCWKETQYSAVFG